MPLDPSANFLFHAAPLHRLPRILQDGTLYAASVLRSRNLPPRQSAARRDRSLGLSEYVHLSLRPDTPLLRDKVRKGYPHAVMAFDRERVWAGANVALVPYNAKAWRTRAAFAPVTDKAEQNALLTAHARGRYPSLEVLVRNGLDLNSLQAIAFLTDKEYAMTLDLLTALNLKCPAPCETRPPWFGPHEAYQPITLNAIADYFTLCGALRRVLPPPDIAFD